MKLQTKYFGEIDYEPSEALSFPVGLPGFQGENSFVLLPFAGSQNNMLCLQSVNTPDLAFVLLDPFSLDPEYTPELQPDELKTMGVEDAHDLYFYVLCAVHNPVANSTVNLRCPVVINPNTLEARQIIMDTQKYEMRHPLSAFKNEQGGSTC